MDGKSPTDSTGVEAESVKVIKALKTTNFTVSLAPTFFYGKTCVECTRLFTVILFIPLRVGMCFLL